VLLGACTPRGERHSGAGAPVAGGWGERVVHGDGEREGYLRDQLADRVVYEAPLTAGQRLDVDAKGIGSAWMESRDAERGAEAGRDV